MRNQTCGYFRLFGSRGWIMALLIGIAFVALPALADNFPSRPITMIVPASPGGPLDTAARVIGHALEKAIGQPVVVENKPGASQKIGILKLLRSAKDGYTIAAVSPAGMTINPVVEKHVGYDPLTDFTYLTQAVSLYYVVVANPSLPVRSLPQLVAYVKAHPNKIAYASSGAGTFNNLETKQLMRRLGINIMAVPYKEDGPAMMGLLGNQVQLMVAGTGQAKPFVDRGKLVALATTGPKRLPQFPNVPTYRQTGIKSLAHFLTESWIGFVAPAGIPAAVAKKLDNALSRVLKRPSVRKSLERLVFHVVGSKPAAFRAMVRSTLLENREIIESEATKAK